MGFGRFGSGDLEAGADRPRRERATSHRAVRGGPLRRELRDDLETMFESIHLMVTCRGATRRFAALQEQMRTSPRIRQARRRQRSAKRCRGRSRRTIRAPAACGATRFPAWTWRSRWRSTKIDSPTPAISRLSLRDDPVDEMRPLVERFLASLRRPAGQRPGKTTAFGRHAASCGASWRGPRTQGPDDPGVHRRHARGPDTVGGARCDGRSPGGPLARGHSRGAWRHLQHQCRRLRRAGAGGAVHGVG